MGYIDASMGPLGLQRELHAATRKGKQKILVMLLHPPQAQEQDLLRAMISDLGMTYSVHRCSKSFKPMIALRPYPKLRITHTIEQWLLVCLGQGAEELATVSFKSSGVSGL